MELVGRSATSLAAAVHAGEVRPSQVVRAHLDQLAHVEPRLGAYVVVRREAALAEAAALDDHSELDSLPLAGVPVAIKDVVDVAGEPTRHGSRATDDRPAREDAEVVARLRAAGAVVIGKTRCPELSLWGTTDGPDGCTVSPWDPSRTAGGSSGGSGAAVAAGTAPIALATDGLGSIRIPAAANGCVGLKPGRGLLTEEVGGAAHWFGLSHLGPIATTAADAALMLAVLADVPDLATPARFDRPLRVAVSWRSPAAGIPVSRTWVEAALEAGRLLRHAGHEVAHVDPPVPTNAEVLATMARWTQGAAQDVVDLDLSLGDLQPRTRAHVAAGERLAWRAPVSDEQAAGWRERARGFLSEYDLIVTPAFARTQPAAVDWHTRSWAANVAANLAAYPFAAPWNLADLPAAVVPVWADAGRPLAAQLVAGEGREDLLLGVAAVLESLAPWTRHAPGWGVAVR